MNFDLDPGTILRLVVPYALTVLGALVFLLVAWILAGWARRKVQRSLERSGFDPTLTLFFSATARWSVLVLAVLAALTMFGIQVTAFAAVIGAAGLAIGLAFQGSLSNFASGIMLLTLRPFAVGDMADVAGIRAKVVEIQIFHTIFDTPDNKRIFVPNAQIFDDVIENETYHDVRRLDVPVGADYDASIDETRAALERAIQDVDGVLEDPAPQVYLKGLGGSSVDWVVRAWAPTSDRWPVREALVQAVKARLDEAGIGIPYPNMDVHLDGKVELGDRDD